MLNIEKYDNRDYDAFIITTETGKFIISFEHNLDLYWTYIKDKTCNKPVFEITKENMFFYNLIETLYNNIKENKISYVNNSSYYINTQLFIDGKIKWYSDDIEKEKASTLEIEKQKDKYLITFTKSRNDIFYQTYSVRICNSGSRHNPYNIEFMQMYKKLCENDYDYHQIHIEEYLYNKNKLTKKLLK